MRHTTFLQADTIDIKWDSCGRAELALFSIQKSEGFRSDFQAESTAKGIVRNVKFLKLCWEIIQVKRPTTIVVVDPHPFEQFR